MSKDFVKPYLEHLNNGNIPCYEISKEVKTHIRTTGFGINKEVSKKLTFPNDPITSLLRSNQRFLSCC